jgi:hypothetical protein
MGTVYAMRRANGDWFSREVNGRLSLPLFHSVHDALMSRLRNFGMLLYKPVTLDSRLLKQLLSQDGAKDLDFCLIEDPFASLEHGQLIERGQLLNPLSSTQRFPGKLSMEIT